MKPRLVLSVLFVLFLAGAGATLATAKTADDDVGISRAGNSSIYFFDVAASDSHGTGKLMINVEQQKFIFNGKDFDPDKRYFLHYGTDGSADLQVFASGIATPSGNLHLEGEWTTDSVELPGGGRFGVGAGLGANYILNFLYIDHLIENKNELIQTGKDIEAGKMKSGGNSGAGMVFGLVNMAVSKYRYTNIMDELNTMDGKVDELLTDVGAIQNQLSSIERLITGLEDWIKAEAKLGTHLSDAEVWIEEYYTDQTRPVKSYNWALWQVAGCDPGVDTCTAPITDENIETFNGTYYTTEHDLSPKDPPTLATDNFYLWWAYAVLGTQAGAVTPYTVNGNTADTIIQQLHDGMVNGAGTTDNGLQAYMEHIFETSACANDVTLCNLYTDVYLPYEAYFQQVISDQITLVQAMVESYAELASFYQANHSSSAYDTAVSLYMSGYQQKLSEEAEAFLEVAEQIALYRAGDGRFDWRSFNTSDAAQLLARADFLAASLVSSATGKPWPWPPGVTGRIFYTESQLVLEIPHNACSDSTCTQLTEVTPLDDDHACQTDDENYPNQCVLTGGWPYLQWHLESGVAIGEPTYTWKLRRLAPQQMAEGTYQVASINPGGGTAQFVVSQYGQDYSNPPAEGTTPVLFGSFNGLEGSMGVVGLGDNRTYSTSFKPSAASNLHTFTNTTSYTDAELKVTYRRDGSINGEGNWYEKMQIRVPDNPAVFGMFPKVRLFWPNTVDISLNSSITGTSPYCANYFYQKVEQSLWLLDSSGNKKSGKLFDPCGTGEFKSCYVSVLDPNDPRTLPSLDPITLNHSMTYTLQAHYADDLLGYYGYSYSVCEPVPASGSRFIWKVYNPTLTLTK